LKTLPLVDDFSEDFVFNAACIKSGSSNAAFGKHSWMKAVLGSLSFSEKCSANFSAVS
jgi:hypothetical protein